MLNFGKYGYGGHITYQSDEGHIERFAFDVCMSSIPIFTKIKQPFALHIFCLVNGFASTVYRKRIWVHIWANLLSLILHNICNFRALCSFENLVKKSNPILYYIGCDFLNFADFKGEVKFGFGSPNFTSPLRKKYSVRRKNVSSSKLENTDFSGGETLF